MISGQKRVMIIEDEADAAEMFAEMMRVNGFEVTKLSNGTSAVDSMRAQQPDLVILDVMMPEISGLDVLGAMHADTRLSAIPVIVVSAKGLPADIKTGLEAGASLYLTKPVGFLELKQAVDQVLRMDGARQV